MLNVLEECPVKEQGAVAPFFHAKDIGKEISLVYAEKYLLRKAVCTLKGAQRLLKISEVILLVRL